MAYSAPVYAGFVRYDLDLSDTEGTGGVEGLSDLSAGKFVPEFLVGLMILPSHVRRPNRNSFWE